jgi:PRTRC genetic system protein E
MFKELAPLLRQRSVLFTVTHIEEDQLRVNVIPKKTSDSENNALTTPMSFTGTAEELDAQLPEAIVSFVGSHLELKNTLVRAKEEMDAAAKAAQEEARNKAKNNKKPGTDANKKNEPVGKEDPNQEPEPPRMPGLFDSPATPSGAESPATTTRTSSVPAASTDAAVTEEDDILAEIADGESDESEDVAA